MNKEKIKENANETITSKTNDEELEERKENDMRNDEKTDESNKATEEIKSADFSENAINELAAAERYAPVMYYFGEENEAQKQPNKFGIVPNRLIPRPGCDFVPEAVREVLNDWYEKINKIEGKCLCVRGACIYFGYGDKNFRFKSDALNTIDGRLEFFAKEILADLRDAGCNYGRYIGFLD